MGEFPQKYLIKIKIDVFSPVVTCTQLVHVKVNWEDLLLSLNLSASISTVYEVSRGAVTQLQLLNQCGGSTLHSAAQQNMNCE